MKRCYQIRIVAALLLAKLIICSHCVYGNDIVDYLNRLVSTGQVDERLSVLFSRAVAGDIPVSEYADYIRDHNNRIQDRLFALRLLRHMDSGKVNDILLSIAKDGDDDIYGTAVGLLNEGDHIYLIGKKNDIMSLVLESDRVRVPEYVTLLRSIGTNVIEDIERALLSEAHNHHRVLERVLLRIEQDARAERRRGADGVTSPNSKID